MGLSLILLWVGSTSEDSTRVKTYLALILEIKGTIMFPKTGIPEILEQLFLYWANQLFELEQFKIKKKKVLLALF